MAEKLKFIRANGEPAFVDPDAYQRPEVKEWLKSNGFRAADAAAAAAGARPVSNPGKVPDWAKQEPPLMHTYVDPKNPSAPPVVVKPSHTPESGLPNSPPVGYVRKYPGGIPGAVRGATQGFTWNLADDVLDFATGGKGEYQDLYEGTARENPLLWGLSNAAGSMASRNPLGVARPGVSAARSAVKGPLTKAADKAFTLARDITGNGLMDGGSRAGAMAVQSLRSGADAAVSNFGQQPQGQKSLSEAGLAGAEGLALSSLMQGSAALPIVGNLMPGGTGGGRFLQGDAAQMAPNVSPFLPDGPLRTPRGWKLLFNPAAQADTVAARLNPYSLLDEAADSAVSASRASPGVLREVLDSRLGSSATPTDLGRQLVSYKVPQGLLPEGHQSAIPGLVEKFPFLKKFLGTGQRPLLPPGSSAPTATEVYRGAMRRGNEVVSEVDKAAGEIDVAAPFSAARDAVEGARTRFSLPSDTAQVSSAIDAAESTFPQNINWKSTQRPPRPGGQGYAAIPGIATPEQLRRNGFEPGAFSGPSSLEAQFGPRAPVTESVPVVTQRPPTPLAAPPAPLHGPTEAPISIRTPGYVEAFPAGVSGPYGSGIPVPLSRSGRNPMTVAQIPGTPSGAPPRFPRSPGPVRPEAPAVLDPFTQVPGPLRPTAPETPGGVMVHPPQTNYVERIAPDQPTLTTVAPFPDATPVPVGTVRTEIGHGLRKLADYGGVEQVPLSNAHAAAAAQGAVGRTLDDHWRSVLSPEDLARGQQAKELLAVAHAGDDLTNPLRAATAAPRSVDSSLRGMFAGYLGSQVAGPAGGIGGRTLAGAVDRASDINPAKMWDLARRAEGVRGEGINWQRQLQGAAIRAGRQAPGAANKALVSGIEEDGPLMSMPDDPRQGYWQNVVDKFLHNIKR